MPRRRRKRRAGRAAGTIGGRPVTELDTQGNWERSEVYANGAVIATYAADNTVYFDRTNWLGTVRQRATMSGGPYETCTSLPYGDDLACAGADPSPLHFTGQPRDTESGLDAFPFRYYNSGLAGWMTPDPAGLAAVNPMNPQSWNPYAYVGDNPMNATDPLGLNGNGSTGCGVGIPADGPCPVVTFTVNVYANLPMSGPSFVVDVYAGPSTPDFVNADLTGVPYCAANPAACMIWGLSQHPNGPGGGGGGGTGGNGVAAAATASPQGPSCSQVRRAAGFLGAQAEKFSSELGWASAGAWVATGVSFLGEAPSLGADSPVTLAAGSVASSLGDLSLYIGAAAAALNGLASGNVRAIGAFDWSHLTGLAMGAAASRIPGLSSFGDAIGGIAEQASSLSLAAQEVCR